MTQREGEQHGDDALPLCPALTCYQKLRMWVILNLTADNVYPSYQICHMHAKDFTMTCDFCTFWEMRNENQKVNAVAITVQIQKEDVNYSHQFL